MKQRLIAFWYRQNSSEWSFQLKKSQQRRRQEVNGVHSPSSHGKFCLHNPLPGGSGLCGPEIILKIKECEHSADHRAVLYKRNQKNSLWPATVTFRLSVRSSSLCHSLFHVCVCEMQTSTVPFSLGMRTFHCGGLVGFHTCATGHYVYIWLSF